MDPGGHGLFGLILGANITTPLPPRASIVAYRRRQVERRDAVGGADLDDQPGVVGAAELVAELRLVAVQRHQFVAQEILDTGGVIALRRGILPLPLPRLR